MVIAILHYILKLKVYLSGYEKYYCFLFPSRKCIETEGLIKIFHKETKNR